MDHTEPTSPPLRNSPPQAPDAEITGPRRSATAIATVLRAALGLAPDEPTSREQAATLGLVLPLSLDELDAGAWIAWSVAGLSLFSGRALTVRQAQAESKRIILALAMLEADGNISIAARTIGTSRRCLREGLRTFGLYPWRGLVGEPDGQERPADGMTDGPGVDAASDRIDDERGGLDDRAE